MSCNEWQTIRLGDVIGIDAFNSIFINRDNRILILLSLFILI